MSFQSGSVSYSRFRVVGKTASSPDHSHLDKLAALRLTPSDFGVPEEQEWGWCGGRHVLDGDFSFEQNVFADCLSIGLRIDTNKVPGAMRKAYEELETAAVAAGNPSGHISKSQKKDVKETVRLKMEEELRSGKHRRSRMIPVLWDMARATVYAPVSTSVYQMLAELFERTFGATILRQSSGSIAEQAMPRETFEALRPTRFVDGPEGQQQVPEYPWVSKSVEPKDFLGNEFMLWLWHQADGKTGVVATKEAGDVTVYFDKSLQVDCAFGQSGADTFKGDGPTRMPEVMQAVQAGKIPRKAGLIIDANKQQFYLTLAAEFLSVNGAKLPDVEEADTARVLFEERIALLRNLSEAIDGLYAAFLSVRGSSSWASRVQEMARWIGRSAMEPAEVVAA